MGKFSRDKGLAFEREVINAFREAGIHSERIPLSGAAGGSFTGDITAVVGGEDRLFELKRREDGYKAIYEALGSNYGTMFRTNRQPTLVALRLSDFLELVLLANKARAKPSDFFKANERTMFRGVGG